MQISINMRERDRQLKEELFWLWL